MKHEGGMYLIVAIRNDKPFTVAKEGKHEAITYIIDEVTQTTEDIFVEAIYYFDPFDHKLVPVTIGIKDGKLDIIEVEV